MSRHPSSYHNTDTLDLPFIGQGDLGLHQKLFRKRQQWSVLSSLGQAFLKPAAFLDPHWDGHWLKLNISISRRPASLWVPQDLLQNIFKKAFPDIDFARLSSEEQALVLENIEQNLISELETVLASDVSILAIHKVDEEEQAPLLTFSMQGPLEQTWPLKLQCHSIEREKLIAKWLSQPLNSEYISNLFVTVAFRCGYTSLSLHELSQLEIGSGIVLDDTTLGFQKIMAVVGEKFAQTCTWQTIKPSLDGPLLKYLDPLSARYTTGGYMMDESEDSGFEAMTATVGEVPVHLVFELGRTEVAINDLESMDSGYVFDLGKPLSQSVSILANGRRIGEGELVRVGDSIGIRVVRLVK